MVRLVSKLRLQNTGSEKNRSFSFMGRTTSKVKNISVFFVKLAWFVNKMTLDENLVYFLNNQRKDIIDYLKVDILNNRGEFTKYIKDKLYDKCLIFESLDEIQIFKEALKSSFYEQADDFVYAFRYGKSIDSILNVIRFFIQNNVGSNVGYNDYVISCRCLEGFIRNDFIDNFSDDDKLSIIENNYVLDLDYENLSFEELRIIKNHNSIYLYKINQENLDLIDKIASVISINGGDKDESFYGYGSLSSDLKEMLYKMRKEIHMYIDIISNMYNEKIKQFKLISSLLVAMEMNVVNNSVSMNLLISKLKCNYKLESLDDIVIELLGISRDVYDGLNIGVNY